MTETFTHSPTGAETPAATLDPIHVIIAHDDHTAYARALRMLSNTFFGHPEASSLRPVPWRFDQLQSERWRRHAVADAPRTEIFVISTNGRDGLPAEVAQWLEECFALRKDQSTAVIALCDPQSQEVAPFRETVRVIACEAGLHYLEADDDAGSRVS